MKNRSTQIMAFAFFLNFNRPASDYSELVHKLAERGFVRRFPRVGYLVAKGEPFVQNRESLEDKARLIESDPEKVSAIGKYSLVATVPLDSGKGIVISHHSDTPKFPSNSSDILEEVTYVINILKDKI